MEPQESSEVDSVLRDYAAEIASVREILVPLLRRITQFCAVGFSSQASQIPSKKGGALLFAVVGAKLSEGLNFTDDLARAVLIVGLPFANLASPELRERMNYVNRQEQQRGKPKDPTVKDAGTELYENMCMNAVNQSIGMVHASLSHLTYQLNSFGSAIRTCDQTQRRLGRADSH